MAHLNRRSDDPQDGQRHRVLEAVESTQAKVIARVVTPMLLTALLGVVLWIGQAALSRQEEQRDDISQIKSDVRDLNTRMTEGVVRQVNTNAEAIHDHEQRLQVLERTVDTP